MRMDLTTHAMMIKNVAFVPLLACSLKQLVEIQTLAAFLPSVFEFGAGFDVDAFLLLASSCLRWRVLSDRCLRIRVIRKFQPGSNGQSEECAEREAGLEHPR
ncbi:hypothetical protein MPTK1_8g12220 [Marchantia polymorpha subsp. ruderalis]|uniref:Uncharacterized protein n=1 Tax=Marchantia polymorpha TaxID=3197 RepID=A0A2R6WJU5_MARPO|nr:hypothetical protein MARPO_0083s0096 [Marchantia polymorpha]BBN19628.1 hypothetical protein Mp_8g12220 [Marchantia polymorpha subsp. ruderalis]|eukprot:PTQ34138.1 hypothetical protein MARPO_0083s0096 [Marchantia polymorpha]